MNRELPLRTITLCVTLLAFVPAGPGAGDVAKKTEAPGAPAPPAPRTPVPAAPLTEAEAVRTALAESATLDVARRDRNVARINADRNKPAFHPDVTATASQLLQTPRVDLPGRADGVVVPNSVSRLEITLRQPLLQLGAGSAPASRARAMAGAAESDFHKAELDTVLETREAYLSLARAEAMSTVVQEGMKLAHANVVQTGLLRERGIQADVDLLEAQRAEADASAQMLQAENGITLARANLNRILGRSPDTPLSLASPSPLPAAPPPLAELTARARDQRPELRSIRHNIEAAEAGIKLARASRLPRVDLQVSYALQTPTALVPESGLSGGVSVSMPLFSGAAQRYTVREAEERVAQLKSALRAQELGIDLEIARQTSAMAEARARIDVADRAIDLARKAYEIRGFQLERGRAIQTQVEAARLDLERALADRAAAENDLRLARARLDRALGEPPAAGSAADK